MRIALLALALAWTSPADGGPACALDDADYALAMKETFAALAKEPLRTAGDRPDLLAAAPRLLRVLDLGYPKELDLQLWKDIQAHKRLRKQAAPAGPAVGKTLAADGACPLREADILVYALARARVDYHARIARAGCPSPTASREATRELEHFLEILGCRKAPR
jgi:hypothetical protein